MKNKTMTGAQAVLESLLKEHVKVIFGYPGGAIMPVYDALYDYKDKLNHILVRHEQAAGHAAEGYARVTGKPGVALATSGPGATNLVTAITDAMLDSVPIVCITGQVATSLLGTDAFQEADIIGVTTPITKWNYQITKASEIAEVFAKAFYISQTGRPGPVLIDITKSAQMEQCIFKYPKNVRLQGYHPKTVSDLAVIKKVAEIVNQAKKPFLLMGHGVLIANAEEEVKKLVEKANIPVACTLHGLSGFPTGHRLYKGMLGMHGNYGPNVLTNSADVIIAVGMRFDDRVTGDVSRYAKNARIIHIDIDPAEFNKNIPVEVAILGDAKKALQELEKYVSYKNHEEWLTRFDSYKEEEYKQVIEKEITLKAEKLTMASVVNLLSEMTKGEAVIVADVGQNQMIAARYYKFQQSNSYITSGGLGTMGFALPAAMGAKMGVPNRQVIVIVGDGGFQMNIQELATLAQEKLPVKVIILNNNFLGMVRQWQELFFAKRYSFVDLKNPNFVDVCKGFFVDAEKVDKPAALREALEKLLAAEGPRVLEVVVEKEEKVFPMMPTGASVSEMRLV